MSRVRHVSPRSADWLAERTELLMADRGLTADGRAVGLAILAHVARSGRMPSKDQIGTALGLTPYAVQMAAHSLGQRGYL